MNNESMWKAVRRIDAAESRAADRMEETARRKAVLLKDGYIGNSLRLIEVLKKVQTEQPKVQLTEKNDDGL